VGGDFAGGIGQHALDQQFQLAAAGLFAEQPGLHHLRVVEDQQVARCEQIGQFSEDAVHRAGVAAIEQARGAAFGGGVLRHQCGWQHEIEIGEGEVAHALEGRTGPFQGGAYSPISSHLLPSPPMLRRSAGHNAAMHTHASPIRFGTTPQHVLVTGGTGFIGRLLVKALGADGHRVSVWTRDAAGAARHFEAGVACVARLQDVAQPCDVVINLAGARILGWPWTAARRATLLASREGLTRRLVDWIGAQPHKPWLLLSASAIGYYGVQPAEDDSGLTEEAPPQPIFMSELCQRWEQAALGAAQHGVQVARLRLGVVLGREGALPQMLLPIRLGLGGPLAGGRQWFTWVHVQDVLRAFAHVWTQVQASRATLALQASPPSSASPSSQPSLQSPEAASPAVWNVTAPGAVRQSEFSRIAAKVLHRPSILPTPGFPLRLLMGEQADLLLQGQRVVPAQLLQTGFAFRFAELQPALEDLR
jgi:uncharacterized protein (TIGR01777 family)